MQKYQIFNNKEVICLQSEAEFKSFKKNYTYLKAAGGLVINEKNAFLGIFRRQKWDLPKGKVEKGEKLKHAAIREVMEETGIENIVLLGKLIDTYHIYTDQWHKGEVLKKTRWYLMQSTDQALTPQTEEDITTAVWINLQKLPQFMENTFENIKIVLNTWLQKGQNEL